MDICRLCCQILRNFSKILETEVIQFIFSIHCLGLHRHVLRLGDPRALLAHPAGRGGARDAGDDHREAGLGRSDVGDGLCLF